MQAPDLPFIDVPGVRAQLKEREHEQSNGANDAEPTPVVVCERISRIDFRKWLDEHDGELRHWEYEPLSETHGRVVVWSLPSMQHEMAALEIYGRIVEAVDLIGGAFTARRTLRGTGSVTCDTGDRDQEADASIRPKGAPNMNDPTVVVEVSCRNERWEDVIAKLERWLSPSTTVQVAIGVKIWPNEPRRTILLLRRNPAFVDNDSDADRFLRQEVDFESANEAPLPEVGFPLRLLYHDAPIPPQLQGHEDDTIVIDLARLLNEIEESILSDAAHRDATRCNVAQGDGTPGNGVHTHTR